MGKRLKRLFDLAFACIGLLLALPLLLVVASLIRLRLGSPVFFTQVRPGLGGRPFRMVKFRTMSNQRDSIGQLLPDDLRLTPFGKFLRATSIDELPELWNVLVGDLSLVGPRPLLMEYLSLYSSEQSRRHDVRPGITGWAQVNGRNAITWEKRFELDVWYVDNHTMLLDIWILLLTVGRVLKREGVSAAGRATMPAFTGSRSGDRVRNE